MHPQLVLFVWDQSLSYIQKWSDISVLSQTFVGLEMSSDFRMEESKEKPCFVFCFLVQCKHIVHIQGADNQRVKKKVQAIRCDDQPFSRVLHEPCLHLHSELAMFSTSDWSNIPLLKSEISKYRD